MKIIHVPPKKRAKRFDISSLFLTNIITCNKTKPDGSVVNVREDNAAIARERVDDIRL